MPKALRGVAIATCYAIALYFLRDISSAHWYLPAGLRFAVLLVTPVSYWPYIYAGECVSLLAVRIPLFAVRGAPWALVSTFTALPPVALIVYLTRRATSLPEIRTGRDVLVMLGGALLASAVTTALNGVITYTLMHGAPAQPASYVLGIWALGQYLGIMMLVPVALLWFNRVTQRAISKAMWLEAAGMLMLVIAATLVFRAAPDAHRDGLSQAARMVLGVAAFALTYRHGWRGSAIGIVGLTLGVGLTAGPDYDPSTLTAQQVTAFVASTLLAAGAVMTQTFELAMEEASSRRRAEEAGRRAWEDTEEQNLEHLARAEAAYTQIMRGSDAIIGSLRQAKRSEDIMRLTGDLMANTRAATNSLMHEIYPAIVFSADGLYGALRAKQLPDGIRCRTSLTGNPQLLSRTTSLNAYRAAAAAMEHLTAMAPTVIRVRLRIGQIRGVVGVYLRVRADTTASRSSVDTANVARLRRRVFALGGLMRNASGEVAILLSDVKPASEERPDSSATKSDRRLSSRPKNYA